ncbi:MAG: septum formation initiator family protein [Candidatus Kerfeldbacteria bacterium]
MPRMQRKKGFINLWRSRAVTLALIIIAGAVSLAFGREIARRVSVQQELDRLTSEISQAEETTKSLETLLATLKSATYEEGAARTRLNLQKPGEKVLVVPDVSAVTSAVNTEGESAQDVQSKPKENNTRRWWDFIFHSASST